MVNNLGDRKSPNPNGLIMAMGVIRSPLTKWDDPPSIGSSSKIDLGMSH